MHAAPNKQPSVDHKRASIRMRAFLQMQAHAEKRRNHHSGHFGAASSSDAAGCLQFRSQAWHWSRKGRGGGERQNNQQIPHTCGRRGGGAGERERERETHAQPLVSPRKFPPPLHPMKPQHPSMGGFRNQPHSQSAKRRLQFSKGRLFRGGGPGRCQSVRNPIPMRVTGADLLEDPRATEIHTSPAQLCPAPCAAPAAGGSREWKLKCNLKS